MLPLPRLSALLPAALLLAITAASAQTPAPEPSPQQSPVATLKISTRIVVLDVVVTDKKGNFVTSGLTKDDFTIVEDKQPQTIRSFDPPASHTMPQGVVVNSAADLEKIGDAPVTLLVLDELNTRFEDMSFSRQAMVKYLQSQPPVLRQPTLLALVSNTRFIQLHDYTQNRDELIDQVKHRMPEYPSKMMAGRSVSVERMAQTLASLEQIAQATAGTPGRKNVIWVGSGSPSADLVGLDVKTADTIIAAFKQATDMLLAARITMYTINPTMNSTVVLDVATPDDLTTVQEANDGQPNPSSIEFSNFAPSTGGRAFLSRNDINNEIEEGIAAGNNYYTLSYAPTNHSDDAQKYRNIVILMKDKNLHATTRNGYYPPTAATQNIAATEAPKQAADQLKLDISSAVNSAISYNGLDVKATKVGDQYVLQVKSAGLDWRNVTPQQDQSEVTVIAAWFTDKNKLLGHSGKELTATRPAAAAPGNDPASAPPTASFALPVTLSGNATRLRFVVRDAVNGRIGTVDLKP